MIIIGIDYSKNSPGVCIREDDKISFMSFMRFDENSDNKRMSKSRKHVLDLFSALRKHDVAIVSNPRSTNIKEYSELEGWKIEDATLLAEAVISMLPETVDIVGIEGFSYGSKGNAGLDIAGYAYCIRRELYKKYGRKLSVFSPGNVKKKAGKGNAGKEEMFEYFMTTQDENLKQTNFWKGLADKTVPNEKPVDDLIDGFYVQECAFEKFKQSNKI